MKDQLGCSIATVMPRNLIHQVKGNNSIETEMDCNLHHFERRGSGRKCVMRKHAKAHGRHHGLRDMGFLSKAQKT